MFDLIFPFNVQVNTLVGRRYIRYENVGFLKSRPNADVLVWSKIQTANQLPTAPADSFHSVVFLEMFLFDLC